MEEIGFPPGPLGKTGVSAGRLGIAGGFGAPSEAVEMAFERGCNYFYYAITPCTSARKRIFFHACRRKTDPA
ncbi:MAG: hypothetical protein ACE5EN_07050 [Nitrospinota bacterium]